VTEKTGEGQDARKKDTVKESATGSRTLGQTATESNRENGSEVEHKRKQGLRARPRGEAINNGAGEQDSRRERQRRGHIRQPQTEREKEKSTEGHRQKERDGRKRKQDEGEGLRSREKKYREKDRDAENKARLEPEHRAKLTRTGSATKGWRRKEQ